MTTTDHAEMLPLPSSPADQAPAPTPPGAGATPAARGPGAEGKPAGPLVITVHGKPAPQGSKRHVGGGRMIEQSKRVRPWREAVKEAALRALENTAAHRLDGPVRLDIAFTFDKPASAPKRRRTWPTTRSSGDIDKLQRSTLDALTDAGVFKDDSQVIDVHARKVFTDDPASPLAVPGAVITVHEIRDQTAMPIMRPGRAFISEGSS
jgi:Holliday junction resolvase RusA-like endonuclease